MPPVALCAEPTFSPYEHQFVVQPQQQQQAAAAHDIPPPPPPAAIESGDDTDTESAAEDSGEASAEVIASRRAVKRGAARRATSYAATASGESTPAKRATPAAKRKALSQSVGALPQRTQLTKAELELGATLDLSREELLNMTSDALEEYARRLASQRPLTTEEQKRFKRQRRLIKNRESAQLSRLRKKAYVDELEREIAQLKEDRDAEHRRAVAAERQAAALHNEAEYLRSLLAQHPTLASLAADRSAFAAAPPPPPTHHAAVGAQQTQEAPRRVRRGVAVL